MKVWLSKSHVLSSNGVEWAGSEDVTSLEYYEHNVGNLAIEVVGQNWSSEVVSLFLGKLGGWAGGTELSVDLLCEEMREPRFAGFTSFTVF